MTRITCTFHEDQYTFCIIPRSVFIRMRNVADRFAEKIKTHILNSISPPPENLAVGEAVWKNTVQPEGPQVT